MSPGHKRQVAAGFVRRGRCSGRKACRYFRLHRSTYRYNAKEPDAWKKRLRSEVRRLSEQYSAWGYKKITRLLRQEGWRVGKRLVQRIRRDLGLRVPTRRARRRRRGESTGLPTRATHRGHVWSWDFIHGRTLRGGGLRMLNVLDEYTRECHVIHVDRRVRGTHVFSLLQRLVQRHGAPEYIRSDNGSEFIHKNLRDWLADAGIKTLYIEPGSPWQNGYIESFHARLREECLDREWLWTLTEARVVIEDWRREYNLIRPHGSLKMHSPVQFAEECEPQRQLACLDVAPLHERYSLMNPALGLT